MKSLTIKQERFGKFQVFADGQEIKGVISVELEMGVNEFSQVTIKALVLDEVQVEI